MRLRYFTAALLALASTALIITAYLGMLNMPDLLSLTVFTYGLAGFGLVASAGLAYDARTGRRTNAGPFGGCFIAFASGVNVVLTWQAQKGILDLGINDHAGLTALQRYSFIGVIAGVCLIALTLRPSRKH